MTDQRLQAPTLVTIAICVLLASSGCSDGAPPPPETPETNDIAAVAAPPANRNYSELRDPCADYTALKKPLFGDLHVHTSFSFDAAANSTGATPTDANRFARGEAIPFFPIGENGEPEGTIQIDRPLDFLAVTDHGEFLGERRLCREPGSPRYDSDFCKLSRESERQGMIMLGTVITTETPERVAAVCGEDGALCREFAQAPWQRMVEAAEAAYDRTSACEFTSFVAYEYTGTPGTSNYHRNVVFRNANVPDLPVSYIDAPIDSALWAKLDAACTEDDGCDYLTIPHNSNLANGRMAPYMRMDKTLANRRAYATKRLQREPIMEIFQHKGGSECINGLSTVLGAPDELCDIEAVRTLGREETYSTREMDENWELTLGSATEVTAECEDGENGNNGMLGAGCVDETDFIRSGLLVGLAEAEEIGANPIKLGMIAATDTHTATPGAVGEADWQGAVSGESTPTERLQPGLLTSGIDGNPGGLAGVWAEENSRDAIFDAMQRREVFGTSGPRIVPRFFAGWGYTKDLCEQDDWAERGYAGGVPMGGDLPTADASDAPRFLAWASKDPGGAQTPLDSLQLIKGWIDADGAMHNDVLTIAGGDGKSHDALCTVFTDPAFDPAQSAYYYLRVVEHPVRRWSTYDCDRLPEAERPAVCSDGSYPSEIREMAWTSPIWYSPEASDR